MIRHECGDDRSRRLLLRVVCCVFFAAIASGHICAVESSDAYCEYVMEEARAQRDLLRTPMAVTGLTQPVTQEPVQMYWGFMGSIGDARKSALVMKAALTQCRLYRVASAAELHLQYAPQRLEQDALRKRLELVRSASESLDKLIAEADRLLSAQTATRQSIYPLLSARVRLAAVKADTVMRLAAYMPALEDTPLTALVSQVEKAQQANQRALNAVTSQSNWNVTWSAGARSPLNAFWGQAPQPYGEASLSYNLGRSKVDKHLEQAATAFVRWKDLDGNDVSRRAAALATSARDSLALQEHQVSALLDEAKTIDENLKLVDGVESNAAYTFKNQLRADRLLLQIDIDDLSHRMETLRRYLQQNF